VLSRSKVSLASRTEAIPRRVLRAPQGEPGGASRDDRDVCDPVTWRYAFAAFGPFPEVVMSEDTFQSHAMPASMLDTDPSLTSKTADELHELLTVDDVAALLKVSKSWVYEHTRLRGTPRGERLPHIKIGKYVRFEASAVRAFLEKKCRAR
jgi:excisionase family DNA binding protein